MKSLQQYYWDIMIQYASLYAIFQESIDESMEASIGDADEKNPLDAFIESISSYATEQVSCLYELSR
jgi:translation initiation factor 2 alpha subunit (eIF-2alpha)